MGKEHVKPLACDVSQVLIFSKTSNMFDVNVSTHINYSPSFHIQYKATLNFLCVSFVV